MLHSPIRTSEGLSQKERLEVKKITSRMKMKSLSQNRACSLFSWFLFATEAVKSLKTLCGQRTGDGDGYPPPPNKYYHPSLTDRGNLRTLLLHTSLCEIIVRLDRTVHVPDDPSDTPPVSASSLHHPLPALMDRASAS